jgi:MerR family transcriptional regulator, light-induced transcriptional regulator
MSVRIRMRRTTSSVAGQTFGFRTHRRAGDRNQASGGYLNPATEPEMSGDLRSDETPEPMPTGRAGNTKSDIDCENAALLWERTTASGAVAGNAAPDPLAAVIRRDIVPALLLQFSNAVTVRDEPSHAFNAQDRAEFTSSLLALPAASLIAMTQQFLDSGFSTEQILLGLLTPVARDLGVLWERDELSFVDVTIATQKLQQVLHALSDRDRSIVTSGQRPAAFMVPAPGEAHSFGLVMMSELLRRRGWAVTGGGIPMPMVQIVETASMRSFQLIGFSISAEALIKPVASAIARTRKRSMNKAVKIVVGGRVCEGNSGLAAALGADGAFYNADDACDFADTLVSDMVQPPV